MFQLIYISTAARDLQPADVPDILATSRRNNSTDEVTGVLLQRGRRFLQVLEGSPDAVRSAVARIERDARHFAIVRLSEKQVAAREFGKWAMASDRDQSPEQVLDRVSQLTANAGANLRAQFMSFAALDRVA